MIALLPEPGSWKNQPLRVLVAMLGIGPIRFAAIGAVFIFKAATAVEQQRTSKRRETVNLRNAITRVRIEAAESETIPQAPFQSDYVEVPIRVVDG